MAELEIKFRLNDGSDIGPKSFPDATTVATLKETIVAQWPRGQFVFFYSAFTCMIFIIYAMQYIRGYRVWDFSMTIMVKTSALPIQPLDR